MKYLISIAIFISFSAFSRSPAVNPGFKVKSFNGKVQKDYVFINGNPVELSKIGFKGGKGAPTLKRKIQKKVPINLAPSFLMFFSLSIPLFAWIFMRDEENNFTITSSEDATGTQGEVLEVDFSKDKLEEKEDLKKVS